MVFKDIVQTSELYLKHTRQKQNYFLHFLEKYVNEKVIGKLRLQFGNSLRTCAETFVVKTQSVDKSYILMLQYLLQKKKQRLSPLLQKYLTKQVRNAISCTNIKSTLK